MTSLYPLPEKYKYFTVFASELKKIDSVKSQRIFSLASSAQIDNLKKALPNIDLDKNIDVVPFCADAFIANQINDNGDGVKTAEALLIADTLKYKFCDKEHSRQNILGTILDTSFSEYGTDKPLTREQVEKMDEPFSVVISGIVWRLADENAANLIEESSNPESENFGKIRLSWEVMFSTSNLILMDKNDKKIKNGKLITDAQKISELELQLKSMGGTGETKDGKLIGRVIVGDAVGIGIGFTQNPAADVGPIATSQSSTSLKLIEDENKANLITNEVDKFVNTLKIQILNSINAGVTNLEVPASIKDITDTSIDTKKSVYFYGICPNCARMSEGENAAPFDLSYDMDCKGCFTTSNVKNWSLSYVNTASELENLTKSLKLSVNTDNKNNQENEKNIETSQSSCVKKDNNNMKLNSIKDITDENLKECKASDVSTLLDSEIKKISDDFETKKKSAEDSKKELESTLASTKETLAKVQEQLSKLAEAQAAKEKEERFTVRMASWESDYELDNDDKEIIASDIKDLDDKGYESWAAKMKKLMKNKKKTPKADKEDAKDGGADEDEEDKDGKKTAKASLENAEKVLDKAIENGEKKTDKVINTPAPELTLAEKTKKAFAAESWSVDARRLKRMK